MGFFDRTFDTVVATFSLCAIPDERQAVSEMKRVLRPGGLLMVADHIASPNRLGRGVQWLMERVTIPLGDEHVRRRPSETVKKAGLTIERQERFGLGLVERLAARKPSAG